MIANSSLQSFSVPDRAIRTGTTGATTAGAPTSASTGAAARTAAFGTGLSGGTDATRVAAAAGSRGTLLDRWA